MSRMPESTYQAATALVRNLSQTNKQTRRDCTYFACHAHALVCESDAFQALLEHDLG